METFWTAGIVALALINVVFLALLLSVARQLELVLVRLGPGHARQLLSGPKIDERVQTIEVTDLNGDRHKLEPDKSTERLLLFISPNCPGCTNLIPAVRSVARDYRDRLRVFVISSGDRTIDDFNYARTVGKQVIYVCDEGLHRDFGVTATPYAVKLDSDNTVRAKGIVNHLEHIESLVGLEVYSERDREPVKVGV